MAILKENTGTLHRQTKTKPTQPDFKGQIFVDGQKFEVAAWVAPTRNKFGQEYLNLKLTHVWSTHPDVDLAKPERADGQ